MARENRERLVGRLLLVPGGGSFAEECWCPSADVYRTREGWLVKFDLAGVRPDEIALSVQGRVLTVAGSRRDWCVAECQHSYSMEIHYNRFRRTVELPAELERAEMSSEYRDGMLLVRFITERSAHEHE